MEKITSQTVDLNGLSDSKDVLLKFGEVFEFGGPDGNIQASKEVDGKGWGINWNAFNDCLRYLEDGGIWLTSKKFEMPLEIRVMHSDAFEKHDPTSFKVMQDILSLQQKEYEKLGKRLIVTYA